MPPAEKSLLTEKVLDYVRPGGEISRHLKGFEAREQQQSMMRDIVDAYNDSNISLVEAGTGTGKSMAYLLPALLWAAKHGERTVISTHTITLQEQLVEKDIPMLLKALGLQLKVVLVKGMGNYLCMRKHEDAEYFYPSMNDKEKQEFTQLQEWLPGTRDGSKGDMAFVPSGNLWERVGAEPDTCTWVKCPFFSKCHFVKARQKAADAQILVVNHHLLFADLAKRASVNNYTDQQVLPAYSHVVIDEAHNIEDVATDYFASHLSRHDTSKLMAKLASDKQGKLTDLKRMITEHLGRKKVNHSPEITHILTQLSIDLPAARREIIQGFSDAFDAFESFVWGQKETAHEQEGGPDEQKMRVFPSHLQEPQWKESIVPQAEALYTRVVQFGTSLLALLKAIEQLPLNDLVDQTFNMRFEITALNTRLQEAAWIMKGFATTPCEKDRVRWTETHRSRIQPNVHLIDAALDISKILREFLFEKFQSVILCSATMTVNGRFDFLRQRLGLQDKTIEGRNVTEHSYESPFNYNQQALLVIPTDMPIPTDPSFAEAATARIWDAIVASRGNCLVLFTSYQMLQNCFRTLEVLMTANRFVGLKQGDDSRYNLLERFRNTDRSVLFATYSFWEGVDISGDALRCVIIVKLPFKVPTEPMIQARSEAIVAAGGDPFYDYSLPLAAVKFQQGFGRLIRHKRDRGCIVCLDPRLITKKYGAFFLNSLPACQRYFASTPDVMAAMKDFYRKTHHYTLAPTL
ncbi:MAG: helicase C-terminal domain-containing protein [Chlamydiales bacterium]|nr:helicase C-terminal domain-containing protein [Chlamydiales bacterium]